MRPRTSSPLPPLFKERADAGGSLFRTGKFGREQVLCRAATRRSHDALAHETGEPAVVVRTTAAHGLEPRHRTSAIHDQHWRAALHAVDEGAEVVLGFADAGLLHMAIIA